MSPMLGLFKNSLLILALALTAHAGDAATFSMKRGLNLDLWMTWPEQDRWDEPETLLPFPEWRQKLTARDLAALKAAGFDFLRMLVDPAPFLSKETTGFRDTLVASVVESARMINAAGMKVVVDMHLIPGGEGRSVGMG